MLQLKSITFTCNKMSVISCRHWRRYAVIVTEMMIFWQWVTLMSFWKTRTTSLTDVLVRQSLVIPQGRCIVSWALCCSSGFTPGEAPCQLSVAVADTLYWWHKCPCNPFSNYSLVMLCLCTREFWIQKLHSIRFSCAHWFVTVCHISFV